MLVFWINDEKVTFIVVWNTLRFVCYTIKEKHSVLVKEVKNNSNKKQVGIEYMY